MSHLLSLWLSFASHLLGGASTDTGGALDPEGGG
jgi:hypothetical protein